MWVDWSTWVEASRTWRKVSDGSSIPITTRICSDNAGPSTGNCTVLLIKAYNPWEAFVQATIDQILRQRQHWLRPHQPPYSRLKTNRSLATIFQSLVITWIDRVIPCSHDRGWKALRKRFLNFHTFKTIPWWVDTTSGLLDDVPVSIRSGCFCVGKSFLFVPLLFILTSYAQRPDPYNTNTRCKN